MLTAIIILVGIASFIAWNLENFSKKGKFSEIAKTFKMPKTRFTQDENLSPG